MKKEKLTCEEARKIDIINYLSENSILPIRENNNSAFFLSIFRQETKASLKVDKRLNLWFDFGEGQGGNIIDLVIKFKGVNVSEALNILSNNSTPFFFHQQPIHLEISQTKIVVKAVKPIQHLGLINYLETRGISISTARSICKEVHFILNEKKYFSIGLKNLSKGWELRNKYFKSGSSPKDISLIKNSSTTLMVTEGMFDMLSLLEMDNSLIKKADLLILNSCSFHEKLMNYKNDYDEIDLYLDHDETGRKITDKFVNEQMNFQDCSKLYLGYNDVNDWLINKNEI
ncbi:toprim domain-containing protein [Maribacter litoralis]|uniref:Toprim-like n=1 Tax=Maribacter litoralis TaxID=2059726 RepID=A0A653TQP5_9FLAO|nr:toprim domain-containing protein [Maribacter litoralis]VXB83457.1 Toprim-like [Maribacter litoralis]